MFGRAWKIGTVGGIPVNVDSSWVWVAVLAVYSLWSQLGLRFPELAAFDAFALAVGSAALFFGSVFLHEVAHAVAARLNDIEVTGITLVFFGGFTSTRADERGPWPAFVIAAAGPLTSFALALVFVLLGHALDATNPPLGGAIAYVGAINGLMAAFNVLPGFPLDGGRMLEAATWGITRNHDRGTRVAAGAGMAVAVGLIAFAVLEVTRYRGNLVWSLWLVTIASLIFQGARAARQQLGMRSRMSGVSVGEAMDPPPVAVPADMTLSEALDRYLRGHEMETFPVIGPGGTVVGVITFESARRVGMRDPLRSVRDALIPLSDVLTVQEEEPLDRAVMHLGPGRGALVLRDGRLVGTITGRSVGRWAART
jgi:Zn-dependent protease/predicted transcriptional regulator